MMLSFPRRVPTAPPEVRWVTVPVPPGIPESMSLDPELLAALVVLLLARYGLGWPVVRRHPSPARAEVLGADDPTAAMVLANLAGPALRWHPLPAGGPGRLRVDVGRTGIDEADARWIPGPLA